MSADDLLYDKITSPPGTKRMVNRRINDYIEVEFEVTTKDGDDEWEIKTITVNSSGPPAAKVIVDTKIIIDPRPPVYQDDYCYAREPVKNDLMDEVRYFSNEKRVKDVIQETREQMLGAVKNGWTPSDFGFVGYRKD